MVETSFFELRMKSVINVVDGKNLGNICDIVLEVCTAKILGFIVPGKKKWYHFFKSCEDIFIPYHNVCKIGVDSILVEIHSTQVKNFQTSTFADVSSRKALDKNVACEIECQSELKDCCPIKCKKENQCCDLKTYIKE